MNVSFALRTTRPVKPSKLQPTKPQKHTLQASLHEPADDLECPILQEPIKNSQGLEWFTRPFDASSPKHSAMTLPCKHSFHAMALVYNWARNRNVLCPVCRSGPHNQQLVMCKLPRDWRYSMSARVRREWKEDKEKAEEENRQVAISIAMSTNMMLQPRMLSFSIIMRIESTTDQFTWIGHAVAIPGAGGLIFQIHPSDLSSMPFVYGDQVKLLPYLLVHPVNFITNLVTTNGIQFGMDDPGPGFFIRFENETAEPRRRRVIQMLYAVNEEIFAQALTNSLIILNET